MKYISRSQWYEEKIKEFLNNPITSFLCLDLYKGEVRRIEKKFPNVEVSMGPKTESSLKDQRFSCVIEKKRNA